MINIAYRYVSMAVLLAEANFVLANLHSPQMPEMTESNLSRAYVTSENLGYCSGRLDTKEHSFGFSRSGKLCFVWKTAPFGKKTVAERNAYLIGQRAAIDTNAAYLLASNCLSSFYVDVQALETTNMRRAQQEFQWHDTTHGHDHDEGGFKDYMPLFEVSWGSKDHQVALVEIDGRNTEFLQIRIEDSDLIQRPGNLVTNRSELLQISNEGFFKMSHAEQHALVIRFGGIHYDNPTPYHLASESDFTFQSNSVFVPINNR